MIFNKYDAVKRSDDPEEPELLPEELELLGKTRCRSGITKT